MIEILVFCSNPVNGGTAEMFVQMVLEIRKQFDGAVSVVPCVNKNNNVQVYNSLEGLVQLSVFSEEQVFGKYLSAKFTLRNICKKIIRKIGYLKVRKSNFREMCDFLKVNNFNAIVIHNGGYYGDDLSNQMLYAASKIHINKRIMVFHNDFEKKAWEKLRYFRYDKNIDKWATELVTVSKYTRDRIKKESFIKKELKVIYNGIEFSNTLSMQEKKKLIGYNADCSLHIGMIGNFMRNKGQLYFLNAMEKVLANCSRSLQVTMIGNIYEEDYYLECKRFINAHERFKMIKIVHDIYNAREFMSLFDIVVVPSIYDESFGLIGVEAMRSAVPVVAFACGGIPEVIENDKDGFVVENKNIEEMAKAILKLIDNPELAHSIGLSGMADYEAKFSRKAMGTQYIKLLTS